MTTNPAAPAPKDLPGEERVYGLHASLAVFRHRPDDIRRVYVDEARLPDVKGLLHWCAQNAIAYHVVGPENLEKVTRSTHHEGVCLLARKPPEADLSAVLYDLAELKGPLRLLLLENVRDPHNVGAIVRTAAHFGVRALLLVGETARRSAALLRTAEGGAEVVQLVSVSDAAKAAAALAEAGFTLLATSSHAKRSLDTAKLPDKVCVLLGAEREGLSRALTSRAHEHIRIDGTGAVESLNVASAAAVTLAALWRQAPSTTTTASPRPPTSSKPPARANARPPAERQKERPQAERPQAERPKAQRSTGKPRAKPRRGR